MRLLTVLSIIATTLMLSGGLKLAERDFETNEVAQAAQTLDHAADILRRL